MRTYVLSILVLLTVSGLSGARQPAGDAFDLIVRGGQVIDGTGNPGYFADVGVRGDTIAEIQPALEGPATRVVDATGLVVAPGFIDIHTHARRQIFEVPTADNYIRQGVTTLVEGPDGGSPVPLRPFLDRLGATPIVPNFAMFIGQGSIRGEVVGLTDREATDQELERMVALVDQGMRDGALGLSSGLFYVPGSFAPTEEVVRLARAAARFGGMYISHMRDETDGILDSVRETILIGERGGLPTQLTHHKIVGRPNHGRSVETLRLVDEARQRGIDVTIDQYPYTASSTSLEAALLPGWALEGGREALLGRLADPATRSRIAAETVRLIRDARGGGDPANVTIASCEWDPSLAGRNIAELTLARGKEVTLEHAADTVLDVVERGGAQGVFHAIDEADLRRILQHPATMVASDGGVHVFGRDVPHPRSYGTFVRVLGHYVRDERVLRLEDAVRKMSSLPAQRLGLLDRGILRPGLKADLTLFSPTDVRDTATFAQPHQYAEGVALVVVNGRIVVADGRVTDERPGRVLYGPGRR